MGTGGRRVRGGRKGDGGPESGSAKVATHLLQSGPMSNVVFGNPNSTPIPNRTRARMTVPLPTNAKKHAHILADIGPSYYK